MGTVDGGFDSYQNSGNLPPSQGGRYSGFGNQVESGPPRSSSVNDFYEGSVNGLTSSWSAFSIGASRLTERMSEAGKKLSDVATQKSSEVYGTVSDKVSNYSKSGWGQLSSMWNQQSNYQQPCEQSNLIYTSGGGYQDISNNSEKRLSSQNSDDWTTGWDTWGQDNYSSDATAKTKKSSKDRGLNGTSQVIFQ